jgi:hypothetical protein
MAYDRFLIAPLNTGLETDLKPWQTPDDSFSELNNAYVFRGRVRKRFGSTLTGTNQLNSRLRISLGNTDGAGAINLVPPGAKVAGTVYKVGQMFSIGTKTFTVIALGNPSALLRSDGLASVATFDTTTGELHIDTTLLATPVYFYPSEPVMGLTMYENGTINNHTAYAFDTQFAYRYSGGSWNQFGPTAGNQWHSSNSEFFWSCNWQGVDPDDFALFTTNFNATINAAPGATDDPIWYFDGTVWASFTAPIGVIKPLAAAPVTLGDIKIQTARIIVPFKDRLVLLNTVETDGSVAPGVNKSYVNRCRFSHAASPLSTTAWWNPNVATGGNYATGGGYIDAPTMEEIVSASFIKDRLIVYFERSTWELAYTGNQVLPFVWNKLNTELGVEATFSVVPFDTVVLGIGTTGIQGCNGSNVERIDDKIPDKVFDLVHKSDAVKRIAGIRDYKTEMVYWAAPMNSADSANKYPDKVLVYNYKNNSWAFNDDSFTAFGYFEQLDGRTWQNSTFPWNAAPFAWNSGTSRAQFRRIIAGNQQGWILAIDPDEPRNAPGLYITDAILAGSTTLNIIDHNLSDKDFIKISNCNPLYIGDTDAAGDIAANLAIPPYKIGQYFVIGADTFTVTALGNPANLVRSDGLANIATFDTTTGALTINNAAATTPVYFYPEDLNGNIYQVTVVDDNNVNIGATAYTGVYAGGGQAARVSRIDMRSKQWNPYINQGRNFYLAKVDFCTMKTEDGEIAVDYFPSSSNVSLVKAATSTGCSLGTNILETSFYPLVPLEEFQERTWHPIYFQGEGQFVQLRLYLNHDQMVDPLVSESPFELEGLILFCMPTTQRLY